MDPAKSQVGLDGNELILVAYYLLHGARARSKAGSRATDAEVRLLQVRPQEARYVPCLTIQNKIRLGSFQVLPPKRRLRRLLRDVASPLDVQVSHLVPSSLGTQDVVLRLDIQGRVILICHLLDTPLLICDLEPH